MTVKLSHNVLLSLATQAIPMVVAVASVPLLVHCLGTERMGLLSMIWVLLSYFSVLDIGISAAVTRSASIALAGDKSGELGSLLWSAVALQITMGIAGAIAVIATAPCLANGLLHIRPDMLAESVTAIRISALGLPVVLVSGSVTGLLTAAARFNTLIKVQAPVGAAQYALPAVLAWQGTKLPAIVLVLVVLRVGSLVATAYALIRIFPGVFHALRVRAAQMRELLSFGIWVMIGSIVSPVLVYADRFLIANRLSLADVAYYSVPLDVVMRLLLFSSSLTTVLYPALSGMKLQTDRRKTNLLVGSSVKYILCGTGLPAILVLLFAEDILRIWINPQFALHGAPVLRVLIFGILANAVARVPYSLLQSQGYPNITTLLQVASLPLQVATSLCLMNWMGICGAAFAWSARLLVETICLFYFANRACNLEFRQVWTQNMPTLSIVGIGCAASALFTPLARSHPTRIPVSIGMIIAGCLLLWRFALTSQDRCLIQGSIRALIYDRTA